MEARVDHPDQAPAMGEEQRLASAWPLPRLGWSDRQVAEIEAAALEARNLTTRELLAAVESAPGRRLSKVLMTPRQSALWAEVRARAEAGDQAAAEYQAEKRGRSSDIVGAGGRVSMSSDGCVRTVTIPAWWTREGQPEVWVQGQIGPDGEHAAVRVWPPDSALCVREPERNKPTTKGEQ